MGKRNKSRARKDATHKARCLEARGTWKRPKSVQLELDLQQRLPPGIYHPTEDGLELCPVCTEWAETAPVDAQGYFTELDPCAKEHSDRVEAYYTKHGGIL